jgi:hypothetical protein
VHADALTREEVLVVLGELRSEVSERRIEGAMTLFAPDADATLIGSSPGESGRWLWTLFHGAEPAPA